MKPINSLLHFESGEIEPCGKRTKRYLSDMKGVFSNIKATEGILEKEDPLVYEVYEMDVPKEKGEISYGTSILYPGKVKDEYFMTKGHFHTTESAEIYLCLKGKGYLLIETKERRVLHFKMIPGSLIYVPPLWAHRTINTGNEKFICFYAFPSNAGHDYKTIEKRGFSEIFLEKKGKLVIKSSRH